MDISRRKALGLLTGVAGGAGLAACGQTGTPDVVAKTPEPTELPKASLAVSFDHGVASGDALADRVILWTRVTPAEDTAETIPVTLYYSEDGAALDYQLGNKSVSAMGTAKAVNLTTSASRDFTVKHDLDGLKPGTFYYYAFVVNTENGPVISAQGRTKTTPKAGLEELKLAVISCSNWLFGYFNVYKALADHNDFDAIVHLGDYIYEYGIDGYGGEVGEKLGRRHDPVTEIVTLVDYRTRHAQYKSDPNLQAAHAICPWYCTWDDHESTNNSYRSGAQNHNPENGEGDWTLRKHEAVQAYLEWMPVRDPQPGRATEAIYRSADFGDLASIFMLESRLTGRSDEISWTAELANVTPEETPAKAQEVMARVMAPERTMLGKVQEDWLAERLKASVSSGKTWQVLANQVILAKVVPPKLAEKLKPEEMEAVSSGYGQLLMQFSMLGLPFNLDAWDGFPMARERLFAAAKEAGARLVTVTGDTHTAWANQPHAADGTQMGVEFGCTSVTSPGLGTYIPLERLGELLAEENADVAWYDPFGHGYTLVTLTPEKARADYYKVSTIESETFDTALVASFEATKEEDGVSPLKQV